ncbi:hypothetical protein [Cryptosporangium phraense]|uniref:Uncharacterized protein n=1 Tax=Cryptosporangium phraense TaxID=2593070 RepID=A0A545ASM5_9ACTN|nr:hypothetical protein [Cryptosporangium phraense]TQS44342.1 hypothetical protein FL583_15530 [Cryptosporangium phraense]
MPKSPYEGQMEVICPECGLRAHIVNRLEDGILAIGAHTDPAKPIAEAECPGGGRPITGIPDF